jgi:hypothetical protein
VYSGAGSGARRIVIRGLIDGKPPSHKEHDGADITGSGKGTVCNPNTPRQSSTGVFTVIRVGEIKFIAPMVDVILTLPIVELKLSVPFDVIAILFNVESMVMGPAEVIIIPLAFGFCNVNAPPLFASIVKPVPTTRSLIDETLRVSNVKLLKYCGNVLFSIFLKT